MFIDTVGCNMTELDTADEESKGNEGVFIILLMIYIHTCNNILIIVQEKRT